MGFPEDQPSRLEQWTQFIAVCMAGAVMIVAMVWFFVIREPAPPPEPPPEPPPPLNFETIARDGQGGTVNKIQDGSLTCYVYQKHFKCMELGESDENSE